MPNSHINEALAHLNQLIYLGAEFPDAVYDTTVAFELNDQDRELLEMLYDEECMCA